MQHHALLDAVLPELECPVTQHWLALENANAVTVVEKYLASSAPESVVDHVVDSLSTRTQQRLAILPAAWQRRAYINAV